MSEGTEREAAPSRPPVPGPGVRGADPLAHLDLLRDRLGRLPRDPVVPRVEPGGPRHAAVALVIRVAPTPDLLLIRRSESPGDPWSGHMALPGGRLEERDPDLLATALRETREETGMVLEREVEFAGRLPRVTPLTRRLPPVSVLPHVFLARRELDARVASREVASVHWVPLPHLGDPGLRDEVEIPVPGGLRRFPCFRLDGQVVWGLTYRVLTDFLGQLEPGPRG